MMLEGPSACEALVLRQIQVRGAVQQPSIRSAMPDIEPESVWCYLYNGTELSDIFYAVLDWAVLIIELSISGAEQ